MLSSEQITRDGDTAVNERNADTAFMELQHFLYLSNVKVSFIWGKKFFQTPSIDLK